MLLFELINPSDQIHFEAPSREVADVCVAYISGMYAPRELDRETLEEKWSGGLSALAGEDYFAKEHGIEDLGAWMKLNAQELNQCWKSFTYGSVRELFFYKSAMEKIDDPEKRQAFADEWDDKHRSSMNKIVAYAHGLKVKSD